MKYYIYSFIASLMLALTACSPEEYDLGPKNITAEDLVEGIAFTITHDAQNPNIVYLENKMPKEYQVFWEHPQGRSLEEKVTLQIPFAGEYEVTFGVQTRGGYVKSNPTKFTVDDMCAEFISDPMWTMISGGSGQSKTWVLDLDADGVSRFFAAPLYFFTAGYTWDNLHNASGGNYIDSDPWDASSAIVPNLTDGAATWYWLADWPGNSWMCAAADYGTMTFDLKNGANVVTDQEAYGKGKTTGTYMLDTKAHTIKFSNAWPVCVNERYDEMLENAPTRTFNILYLTDDFMQLLIPGSGTSLNFISQEYADNYVPEPEEPEPTEPQLPEGWKDDVSETVSIVTSSTIKWTLSTNNPVDWASQSGKLLNGWTSPSDYPDWLGVLDPAVYENFSMTLDSKALQATFTAADGSETAMPYTLDDKGIYTFNGTVPTVTVIGWMTFRASDAGTLRILSIEKDNEDNLSGMWLGIPNPDKPDTEYIAYHFIPTAVGGGGATDKNALIKERLTGGSSRTYRLDYDHIICTWANNWAYDNITDGKKANYVSSTLPDWTGWTYSAANVANVDKFRLTFGADGSLVFVNNKGESTTTTYTYLAADDWYGLPLVQFPENLDMFFELTGNEGGWLNFELQFNKEKTNDDGTVTPVADGVPQGGGFLELYDWDLDASGKVTGLWLGMDNGNGAASLTNLANQRKVFHLIVE